MSNLRKLFMMGLALTLAFTVVACGGNVEMGDRVVIQYLVTYNSYSYEPYKELIDTYNNGLGITDNVYVQPKWVAGEYGNYMQVLSKNTQYNVVTIADSEFKTLAVKDYFVSMEDYLTDSVKEELEWNTISSQLINRFRLNSTVNSDGKYEAGEGTTLLGMPIGNNPQVLYYNANYMESLNINIISVAEEDLDAYNTANSGILEAHGYAEYLSSPYNGAVQSTNSAGESVYKVFNNRIAMDWAEYRCLASYLQNNTNATYGLYSEWWFNYGFSIGADCIGWNNDTNSYELVMDDKTPNYLILKDTTINGVEYTTGETVYNEDKDAVTANMVGDTVYKLPSNYDMFIEFCRLIVNTSTEVDDGIYGYGIADTADDMAGGFLAGTTGMMVNFYDEGNSMNNSALKGKWEYAPTCVYKEFTGGDRTYTSGGKEYLKVIGKTYEGTVYSGELKEVNGTVISGVPGGASEGRALCIPKNSDSEKYDAAFKFIKYAASAEGQAIIAKSNAFLPNQSTLSLSDDFSSSEDRITNNAYAAAYMAIGADLGDYSYFQTQTWVSDWSTIFNDEVRMGTMKFSEFITSSGYTSANSKLQQLTMRIYGR